MESEFPNFSLNLDFENVENKTPNKRVKQCEKRTWSVEDQKKYQYKQLNTFKTTYLASMASTERIIAPDVWLNLGMLNNLSYLFGTLWRHIRFVWSRHGYFGSTASCPNTNPGSTKLAWYATKEKKKGTIRYKNNFFLSFVTAWVTHYVLNSTYWEYCGVVLNSKSVQNLISYYERWRDELEVIVIRYPKFLSISKLIQSKLS